MNGFEAFADSFVMGPVMGGGMLIDPLTKVDLDELPKRDVSSMEFAARALDAGWDERTVHLLLDFPPVPAGYFKVGNEKLRIHRFYPLA